LQQRRVAGVPLEVAVLNYDEDLDEAIRADLRDDLDAGFARLVATHQRTVVTIAGRVSDRPQDADDLAAEAFLRAWRALRGYDRERIEILRFRPWLVTIVLNLARNARRDASRRPRESALDNAKEPVSSSRDGAEVASASSDRAELVEHLRALPERERTAVVLRHVAGLPVPEIAEALGCPEGTARSHVARGLAKLRSAYDSPGPASSARKKGTP